MRRFQNPAMPFQSDRRNPAVRRASSWVCHGLTVLLCVAGALALARLWRPFPLPGNPGWPEAGLLLLAAASTLAALTRHLPLQNVVAAALLIAFAGGAVTWLDLKTGIPFGPLTPMAAKPKLFGTVPWMSPVLWIVAVLNSRGTARLILRPWRKTGSYGFQLLGLTATLTALFDLALEPFATKVKHYWSWAPTKFPVSWHGAPLTDFFGWAVTTALMLAFVTPLLINKQPLPKNPPDFHPLGLWLGGILLLGAGCASLGLWSAATLDAFLGAGVAAMAVRGARW